MPKVKLNGITLHYQEQGSGEPLLLISGLGANRNSWAAALPHLVQDYRCITLDNRGTGQSDVPAGPYPVHLLSDDTAALIEHLGYGPVAAIGTSMGGMVLQSILIDYPSLISKAVLVSTLPRQGSVQRSWLDGMLALRKAGVERSVASLMSFAWVFTAYTLADHTRLQAILDLAAQDPEPTTLAGFAAQVEGLREYDRRSELGQVSVPTLVVAGAEDILTPASQAAEIASLIPNAKLVIMPRGGHSVLAEYPGPTLATIRAFLAA